MFKELAPIIAERTLHLLLSSAKDGKIIVYVEPAKKDDKEDAAFVTPLRLQETPEELDAQLGTMLTQWVNARQNVNQSLQAQLDASKAQMEANAADAKKAAAEKAKKPSTSGGKPGVKVAASKSATAVLSPTPSLLDAGDGGDGDDDDDGVGSATADSQAAGGATESGASSAAAQPTPVPSVPVAAAPVEPVATASAPAPVAVAPAAALVEESGTIELF